MQLIPVELEASGADARCGERCFQALSAVIDDIGSDDFGSSALAALNRWVPLSWWSVYRLFDDQPPTMYTSGSFGVADGTRESFRRYRQTLYQHDQTFFAARECTRDAPQVVMHWHAMEIPRRHREEIYLRHGLRERLSIVSNDRGQGLLAVNFYRHEHLEPFADDEIDAFRTACVPLLSCVRRHLSLSSEGGTSALAAGLTGRERDVCERLLKGWTHDGIAADLRVSPATVKTYRDRAFARLGIHHRNELFALVAKRLAPPPAQ